MFTRFIAALNTISSPILAIIVILLGCGYSVISKIYGLDSNTAAGIVGAGIGLLTGQIISRSSTQTDGLGSTTTQTTGISTLQAPLAQSGTVLVNGTPVRQNSVSNAGVL